MTNLVQFLRREGLEAVTTKLSVATCRHKKHPQLILFKYDQINSPFNNKVVQNCRGIILDESDDWRIVSYPYDKFFNHGESNAAHLNFKKPVRVTDKLDGSLMTLYYYKDEWHIATSGKPDASGKIRITKKRFAELMNLPVPTDNNEPSNTNDTPSNNNNVDDTPKEEDANNDDENEEVAEEKSEDTVDATNDKREWLNYDDIPIFSTIFWAVWKSLNYTLPSEEDRDKCFMFEFLQCDGRIIVKYDQDDIFLHGVRNLTTLAEEDHVIYADKYKWKSVPFREYKSLEEISAAAAELNPAKAEGFVACDVNFKRLKVKSPNYVQMALLTVKDKEGLNERRMLKLVITNESEEFFAYFPQWRPLYDSVNAKFLDLVKKIDDIYATVKDVPDGKKFFEAIQAHIKYMKMLTTMKKTGLTTSRSVLIGLPERQLISLLNIK